MAKGRKRRRRKRKLERAVEAPWGRGLRHV